MWLCADCGLAQLVDNDPAVPQEPAGKERAALTAQRHDAVAHLVAAGVLPSTGSVTEFPGPHGRRWLKLLAAHGFVPARPGAPADVVVDGCFDMMREPDQLDALNRRVEALRPGGVFVAQIQSLAAVVAERRWHALRFGHYAYYSTPCMIDMLGRLGLGVTTAHRFPLDGGTVLLTASANGWPDDPSIKEICQSELAHGVLRADVVAELHQTARDTSRGLREMLEEQHERGARVYGYGAAPHTVSLLRLAEVDAPLLAGVADPSAAKQGRRMPGTDIPVMSPDDLVAASPDVVVVFVNGLIEEARRALPQIEAAGGQWLDAGALGERVS
jgi:hypothetical protein